MLNLFVHHGTSRLQKVKPAVTTKLKGGVTSLTMNVAVIVLISTEMFIPITKQISCSTNSHFFNIYVIWNFSLQEGVGVSHKQTFMLLKRLSL